MPVEIVAAGFLKPLLPEGKVALNAAGRSIDQALTELGVDTDLVAMVLVNGRQVPKNAILQDGDLVKLIPFIGGG